MPSDRFLKLDKEKRKRILDSAFMEFSGNRFDDVSINRIVRNAGISRGSFYTYFEDKMELFEYVLREYGLTGKERLEEIFHEEKNNCWKSFRRWLIEASGIEINDDGRRRVKQIFIELQELFFIREYSCPRGLIDMQNEMIDFVCRSSRKTDFPEMDDAKRKVVIRHIFRMINVLILRLLTGSISREEAIFEYDTVSALMRGKFNA